MNTSTVIANQADLEAIHWIDQHIPQDARFFINVTPWLAGTFRGVDCGWWITPLTGRLTMLPPVLYASGDRKYILDINALAEKASRIDGRDVVKRGRLGNWTPKAGAWVAELRGLRQASQQPVGSVVQPVCRYRLGDSDCGVNLGPLTHAGTVTAVASLSQFTAGAFGQAEGTCSNGVLTWSTGTNAGLQCKIRTQTVAGVITLSLPLVQAIQIGDTFSAIEGCSGRLLEDCRDRFDNVLNFGGEPHLPGQDQLSSPP